MNRRENAGLPDGLLVVGGVVVLSGDALKTARACVRIAILARQRSGYTTGTYEALAAQLGAAMSAAGQSDVRPSAVCDAAPVQLTPDMPLAEAAAELGLCDRQTRRLAPRLGGQKISGRWFFDRSAVREHIEGSKQ